MTRIAVEPKERLWVGRLWRWLLAQVWFVHTPVVLMVKATQAEVLQLLVKSAKPSANRLDLRNLFQNGRRYFIQPRTGGFRLTTTRGVVWRFRRRTTAVVVMNGSFADLGDDVTRIQLETRLNVSYFLDAFLIPLFMTSILIYMPWSPWVIGAALLTLYMSSWLGHRYNAALEAGEMVWYVQKVLGDFIPAEIKELSAMTSETIYRYNADFEAAWERFYEEHQGK
ncbi:MAG: hypothetical protein OHK0046_11240 [Anaerolineae bacterium]